MKLHTKLYLFFAGTMLLPLLVVTVAASIVLERSGTETYQGRIQSGLAASSAIVTEQAHALDTSLQGSLREAETGALIVGDETRRQETMAFVMRTTGAQGLVLRDPAGNVISRSGLAPNNHSPTIAASVRLAGPGGEWRMTAMKPYDTDALNTVFSSQEIDWALLDGGVVSVGSLPEGASLGGLPADGNQERNGDTTGAEMFTGIVGEKSMMIAAVPVPSSIADPAVTLVAGVPSDTVGAASTKALEAGLLMMLGVAFLAVTLGLLLARTITEPLRKLTNATVAGIEGDLGVDIEVKSRDEIGSLASSFSLMQSSIRSNISELEESRTQLLLALSYAGDILGSTTDRERLMKTTADAARLATGAVGIWVELFGGDQPDQKAISTAVPSGFFRESAADEAGRLARDVASGKVAAGETLRFDSKEAVTYPLMHDRKALGALVAIFDLEHPPEDSRKKILSSLAMQAASAVENVNFGELQRRLAITDPLTGLYNFRFLSNSLDREMSKSQRYGRNLSAAILDLDDFKKVNDTYGHQAGDELLKAVARVLTANVRQSDMVTRYGGEEFSVVFPETPKQDALKVAEKLRRGVAGIRLPDYPEVRATTSIGVASYPEDSEEQTDLMMKADQALYRAKESGKNRCIPYS
ncbi:MAG: diguanylate cyclase [Thermoleophilia bacterium]|jgi:diguanylate cyclase (GGDEF)-like protein